MKKLTIDSLEQLCSGAAILGSGGGGDPSILKDYLHYLLKLYGPVDIISSLPADSLVVPVAIMGAPLISLERIPNRDMFAQLYACIAEHYPNRKIVLMPAEIGGCNALTPFIMAAMYSLAVLDADLIGRAFPKINMSKPAVMGITNQKAFITNHNGERICIEAESIADLETQARTATMKFGCSALLATFIFDAALQENYIISGSITRALQLGGMTTESVMVGSGVITDVFHKIENGFLTGSVSIFSSTAKYKVYFQNEYLHVKKNEQSILESPTIISLVESRSRKSIASESLRYSLQVEIMALDAPLFWQQAEAKKHVGLDVFKF